MVAFTIYPAIDLRGGRVVRLKQGRASDATVYSDDPAETASRWQAEGAAWLHVVDLDRAFGEAPSPNLDALRQIIARVQIPLQVGGGMRSLAAVQHALDLGVSRVVVGTLAVENTRAVETAVARWGADKLAAAIDTRGGRVATRGWNELSDVDALECGKRLCSIGVRLAVVTDIARDGMLSGVDAAAMTQFARATGLRVIASGGVAGLDDLRALWQWARVGVAGAIVGRALYSGAINLRTALQALQGEI